MTPAFRSTDRVPAVVLGGGLQALGVTRCLAREGVPVLNLSGGSGLIVELVRRSRWYTPLDGDYDPRVERDPERLGRHLSTAVSGEAVLFPCSDDFVATVASLPRRHRERFRSFLPGADVVRTLMDKSSLAEAARRADVPHPATRRVESVEELERLDSAWFERALLKPTDSLRFFREHGVKARPVRGRREAIREFEEYFADSEMEALVQKIVPGSPSTHVFLDGYRSPEDGIVGLLVRRRERMYPPDTGNSTSMITVPRDSAGDAVASLRRLLERVGFHGIFSAEYKEDASDGVSRLIEVNVRPWWFVEFTARCGVDTCSMAYRDVIGAGVEPDPSYEVGRRCVYRYYDLQAGLREVGEGRLSPLEWLRSWVGSDSPIFARDDPAPALRTGTRRALRAVRRRLPG